MGNTLFDIDADEDNKLGDIASALDSDDDDHFSMDGGEERKGGEKMVFMPASERYYFFRYFENNMNDFLQAVV
jgi:hypothetical protein